MEERNNIIKCGICGREIAEIIKKRKCKICILPDFCYCDDCGGKLIEESMLLTSQKIFEEEGAENEKE